MMENNNSSTHNAFHAAGSALVSSSGHDSASSGPKYQLPAPRGPDMRAMDGSGTFWRDMLNLSTSGEHKPVACVTLQSNAYASQNPQNGTTFLQYPGVFQQQGPAPGSGSLVMHGNSLGGYHSNPVEEAPPPRVYKPCAVCSDKASGYHYGVCSCEGCKGFFRRSVQKNMEYVCHKEKQCVVNKITRNRCQYCRLQKCYAKGMSKEAVRNDRHKRRRIKEEQQAASSTNPVTEELTKEEEEMIDRIVNAHNDTFPLVVNDDNYKLDTADLSSDNVLLWERVRELSTHGIVEIVKFGKGIQGFGTLTTSDQITLLKAACLEILILRLSSRYHEDEDRITFSGGVRLSRDQLERGGFGSLTETIFKFATCMQQYELDKTEYAMLCAVCLMSGDRSGLEQPETVEKLQEPLLEALKHYVRQRRPAHAHAFAKMLMKLSDLRGISVKGAEKVLKLRTQTSTELPPLIVEMLDRAENVCIPP